MNIFKEAPFHSNFDEQGPYIGGDMRFGESQLAELKSGMLGNNYRWPLGHVPTEVDSSFSKTAKICSVKNGGGGFISSIFLTFFQR